MSVNIYNSNPNATSEEENFTPVADRGSKLASDTIYSNTTSGLNSVNVQGAIDEVNDKVEDNVEAISQINSDLSVIGNVYSASASNISIPASTDTLLLSNPNMPFGKYIAIGKVSLTGVQPDGGALFSMKTSDNGTYVREVSSISFIGNETIVGIVEFNEQNDFARLYYYSYNAVTVSAAEITLIKIS